jgi:hypothetical protein
VSHDSCQLVLGVNAEMKCISSQVKHDWKGNRTIVFFDMVPGPHIATKNYKQKPRK